MVRRALASAVRTARHISAAIALGALSLGLAASSVAHAGVPLPVVAETTGMLTLAAVVKRIAPSVVIIEGRGRLVAKRRGAAVLRAAWQAGQLPGRSIARRRRYGTSAQKKDPERQAPETGPSRSIVPYSSRGKRCRSHHR